MGTAIIGAGEASGERRALRAAEAAIANPLLEDTSMKSARGVLISITGGDALTLFEVDEAAGRIRQEVGDDANIIVGATIDAALHDGLRVSVVATGIDQAASSQTAPMSARAAAEPDPKPTPAASASVQSAPEPDAPQAQAAVAEQDLENDSPGTPVIPFPEPTTRRDPIRRRTFLERLGVSAPETHNPPRASGWR